MWNPITISNQKISEKDFEKLVSGQVPAIIIKNFYSKEQCVRVVKKIEKIEKSHFSKTQLEHIGPFLMSYTTKKEEYFRKSKEFQKTISDILGDIPNPLSKVSTMINNPVPTFSVSLAK